MAKSQNLKLTLDRPPPAPAHGACELCSDRATRLVQHGNHRPVPVCLWHSLTECHTQHAHLVRVHHITQPAWKRIH